MAWSASGTLSARGAVNARVATGPIATGCSRRALYSSRAVATYSRISRRCQDELISTNGQNKVLYRLAQAALVAPEWD